MSTLRNRSAPVRSRVFGFKGAKPVPFIHAVSANGRYFVDRVSDPYLARIDSPWGIMHHLAATDVTDHDMGWYMRQRAGQGFNTLIVQLLVGTIDGGISDTTWITLDGVRPFTTDANTTMNEPYWARVDTMLTMAERYGLTMFIYTLDTFGSAQTFTGLAGGGTTEATAFGVFLGNRYKTWPNIVWAVGGDYDNSGGAVNTAYDAVQQAVLDGISSTGDTHLSTVHLTGFPQSNSFDYPAWDSTRVDFSFSYSYNPTYDCVLKGYAQAWGNSPTTRPTLFAEGNYFGENNKGHSPDPSDFTYRKSYCWSLTSGSTGVGYGAAMVWYFETTHPFITWWERTESTGDWGDGSLSHQAAITNFFKSIQWWTLVPDTGSVLVTAGRGTYVDGGDGNLSTDVNTNPETNNYVTAGKSAGGTLAVIYIPDATSAITVSWATMAAGSRTATWIDPTDGAQTAATPSATSYSHSANAAGDTDWLLMLTGA